MSPPGPRSQTSPATSHHPGCRPGSATDTPARPGLRASVPAPASPRPAPHGPAPSSTASPQLQLQLQPHDRPGERCAPDVAGPSRQPPGQPLSPTCPRPARARGHPQRGPVPRRRCRSVQTRLGPGPPGARERRPREPLSPACSACAGLLAQPSGARRLLREPSRRSRRHVPLLLPPRALLVLLLPRATQHGVPLPGQCLRSRGGTPHICDAATPPGRAEAGRPPSCLHGGGHTRRGRRIPPPSRGPDR